MERPRRVVIGVPVHVLRKFMIIYLISPLIDPFSFVDLSLRSLAALSPEVPLTCFAAGSAPVPPSLSTVGARAYILVLIDCHSSHFVYSYEAQQSASGCFAFKIDLFTYYDTDI